MTKMNWIRVTALCMSVFIGGTWAIAENNPPSAAQIEFAEVTYDLMFKELVAALFTEFNDTTAANVEQGKLAISLIFHNKNKDMRLVGTVAPLLGGSNDLPRDNFEDVALAKAFQGQGHRSVERVAGKWYLRRSFALNNNLHPACVLCHTNFLPNQGNQWVGALMQRVPIKTGEEEDAND